MSETILIVDDQEELTQILAEYFRHRKGYNVFTAVDGQVALDLIKKYIPELVLLDMKLPLVNGLEILKVLRREYPQTKVIVMTVYDIEYKKNIDAIGYDAFFIKPLIFGELKDKVDELLSDKFSFSKEPLERTKPSIEDKEGLIPKANIVIIETRGNLAVLLKHYLEHLTQNGLYRVLYFKCGSLFFNEIVKFNPDIILYDIVEIGTFTEFATKLMKSPNPPKEIILFGDPKFKWEEVDLLIKRGAYYIPTPLDRGAIAFPAGETIERLVDVIREVCFKHNLLVRK